MPISPGKQRRLRNLKPHLFFVLSMSVTPTLPKTKVSPDAPARSGPGTKGAHSAREVFEKPRIMITPPQTCGAGFLPQDLLERVERMASKVLVYEPRDKSMETWYETLRSFRPNIIVCSWGIPPMPVDVPPELRYICHLCGTVRHWLPREVLERGVIVTNWGATISRTIAECTLLLTLSALRRATYHALTMHGEKGWDAAMSPASLFGRRIGIHGFGNIAREFAELVRPFGCPVTAFDPYVTKAVFAEKGVIQAESLEALFDQSQIVVELAALTPETRGSVTEALLRRLPPDGVFINTGRPQIVDNAALLRIAREGRLQVGLDVYEQEPLPADSPLRGLPNVTLLPHIGGPTADHLRFIGEQAVQNIQRFIVGEELDAVITLDGYDRMT